MQKEDILGVTEHLFFSKQYGDVKLDLIANELSIQKPTLYYYFKNKKEIFLATIEYSKKRFFEAFDQATKGDLYAFMSRYIQYPTKSQNLFAISYQHDFCEDTQARKIIFMGKQQVLQKTQEYLADQKIANIQVFLLINLLEKLAQNNCIDKYCLQYEVDDIVNGIVQFVGLEK